MKPRTIHSPLITDFINNVTYQIFINGEQNDYTPIGSGVIVKFDSKLYILTASHVSKELTQGFFILTKDNELLPIRGKIMSTDYQKDSQIDISYIRLDLPQNDLKYLNHFNIQVSHEMISPSSYFVCGYPAFNTKFKKGALVKTGASGYYLPSSKDKVYNYHNFNKKLFYSLDFKGSGKDLSTNEKTKIVMKQNGLSGGGLWHIHHKVSEHEKDQLIVTLIGIMTDQRRNKYSCLIGNKIDSVIHSIARFENSIDAKKLIQDSDENFIINIE